MPQDGCHQRRILDSLASPLTWWDSQGMRRSRALGLVLAVGLLVGCSSNPGEHSDKAFDAAYVHVGLGSGDQLTIDRQRARSLCAGMRRDGVEKYLGHLLAEDSGGDVNLAWLAVGAYCPELSDQAQDVLTNLASVAAGH